jgi:hypothetical protein
MNTRPLRLSPYTLPFFLVLTASALTASGSAAEQAGNGLAGETRMTVELRGEDRDVGLKRMEILEKALSPELLERKRAFVRSQERDYNEKIGVLLQRLTTSIGKNTVITHMDVDYFVVDFEDHVQAVENITVTILLDEDGLAKWASGRASKEAAVQEMEALIHGSFGIPLEQIKIVTVPN